MATTPNLGAELLEQGQSNADIVVNGFMNLVDALMSKGVINEQDAPPGGPSNGDVYLVGSAPSGAWVGQAGKIAYYYTGWSFFTVPEGWLVFDRTADTLRVKVSSDLRRLVFAKNTSHDVDIAGKLTALGAADVTGLLTLLAGLALSVETGLTASTTQSQGEGALDAAKVVHGVTTVANPDDVVTLPAAAAGRLCIVANHGANQLQVFPAAGDGIAAGSVDASVAIGAGKSAVFVALDATTWALALGA